VSAGVSSNRGRRRSNTRRATRGLEPKLRPRTRRRLDIVSVATVRHDVYLRTRDVVRRSGVVPALNRRLRSHLGQKCSYDAEALLVGALLVVALQLEMEHTNVTKALGSLAPQVQHQLGLLDAEGYSVSYRSVNQQLSRLAEVLRSGWEDDDGTYCDLNWMLSKLLKAAVPSKYHDIDAFAVDATSVDTWGAFIGAPSDLESDESVLEAAKLAAEIYAEVDGPATLDAALDASKSTKPLKRNSTKKAKKAPPPGAVIGPDGRIVHTTDADARGGYRTATNSQRGSTFVGYHLHLATGVRSFSWQGDVTTGTLGEYVPPFILGLDLTPANSHPGEAGTRLVERVVGEYSNVREVLADRGYTGLLPETFIWPARSLGLDVVMDLNKHQRTRVDTVEVTQRRAGRGGTKASTSVIVNAGTVLHDWAPTKQHQLPPIPKEHALRESVHLEYEARAQLWRWSVLDRDRTTGDVRLVCPFHAGRVRNKNIKVRKRVAASVPHVKVPARASQCCCGSITMSPKQLSELWQPVPYGTRAWAMSYGRRAISETANALLKSSFARLERGYFKVMGQHKVSLLIGLLCVGVNIEIAHRLEEFGVPRQLTAEERAKKRAGRGGRKRRERTLAELAKRYPEAMPGAPPGSPPPTTVLSSSST
jgi:hypothetical protein